MMGSKPLDPLGFGGDFVKVVDVAPVPMKETDVFVPYLKGPRTMGDIVMLDRDDPDRRWQQVRVESNPRMTPDRFREMYLGQFDQDYGRCAYCGVEVGEEHMPRCEYWARRRIREEQLNHEHINRARKRIEQIRPRSFCDAADAMVYALTGPKLHNMPKRRVVIERKS